tara:strand:- start:29 stop:343 length:315 start_codon:yes stop_codon:yes gene_type:complete
MDSKAFFRAFLEESFDNNERFQRLIAVRDAISSQLALETDNHQNIANQITTSMRFDYSQGLIAISGDKELYDLVAKCLRKMYIAFKENGFSEEDFITYTKQFQI